MIVLLDVGNTAVTCGLAEKGRIKAFASASYSDVPKIIKNWAKKGAGSDLNILISSVAPKTTHFLKKSLKGLGQVWIAGKNLPVPVKHRYKSPKRLGIDRLVDIYGALKLYKTPLLMIDFGTAITFDYVSKSGVFEGGMIVPGPQLSFQTLCNRAAQLPKNAHLPQKASGFLGRDTYECLASGVLEGYGALADGLVARFKERFGAMQVIATGGFASTVKRYAKSLKTVDPQHSVKSLLLLFQDR